MTAPALVLVKSPCTNVCQMHQPTGWCEGCARTISEITAWSRSSEADRCAILKRLPARRDVLLDAGIFTAAEPSDHP